MTAQEIIRQIEEDASEYLEMVDNPAQLVAGILASKVHHLNSKIEYLERRLSYYVSNSPTNH